MTTFTTLLEAQWAGYAERHQDRGNLILHILAVPLFWWGALDSLAALLFQGLVAAFDGVLLMVVSVFLQGLGHDREAVPPEPWAGVWVFVQRLVAEQFVNFPRYVISGAWWRIVGGGASSRAYGGG
ncbi:terminase [Sinimarinibacterium thermocellulolyticum]|uniref:Terminase n=1 Tax=Sinimarinibacterium thermocellulolyticum TaxID=3170016 RepID=A0ABV2A8P8_9GAMM